MILTERYHETLLCDQMKTPKQNFVSELCCEASLTGSGLKQRTLGLRAISLQKNYNYLTRTNSKSSIQQLIKILALNLVTLVASLLN